MIKVPVVVLTVAPVAFLPGFFSAVAGLHATGQGTFAVYIVMARLLMCAQTRNVCVRQPGLKVAIWGSARLFVNHMIEIRL